MEKFHKTYDSAEEKELPKSCLTLKARRKMVVAKLLIFVPFSKARAFAVRFRECSLPETNVKRESLPVEDETI